MSHKLLQNTATVFALLAMFAIAGACVAATTVDSPSVVAVGNSFVVGKDLVLAMDAFSRAANLQPLKPSSEDELRVWSRDYMHGGIVGYVFSAKGAIKCQTASHYASGVITIDRARCRPWPKGSDALVALDALTALDGMQWDCPVFDGGEVFIEGMRHGRRIALRAGNPWACDDPRSTAVMKLLDKLG